jgi:hypothetical protein
VRLLGAVTGAGLVVAGIGSYMLTHHPSASGVAPAKAKAAVAEHVPPVVTPAGLEEKSGVRVAHVAITGAGGLVDLRYQVIDPDKAASVHATAPELVDETTGVVVNQLFMGHTHKGVFHAGQTYYLIFNNPGNLVQRGSQVTVVLGDARLPHVPVQ